MREDKYCNYRMKLITKKVEKDFMSHPLRSQDGRGFDAEVIVKYFNLITEAEKQEDGDWLLFGYACIHEWEWGYVLLSELRNLRLPFGMTIERDLYSSARTVREHLKRFGITV